MDQAKHIIVENVRVFPVDHQPSLPVPFRGFPIDIPEPAAGAEFDLFFAAVIRLEPAAEILKQGVSDISADFVQDGAYFPVLRINHKWFLHDIIYSVSPVLSSLAWDWIRNPSRR